jgi:adenylate kinase
MFLVLLGAPGAGKGTQSQRLVQHLKIPHLSTGDLLRQAAAAGTEVGRLAQTYMQAGQLVPDEVMLRVVAERLERPDCREGCLLDGFPRTLVQAQALDELLARRRTPLDAVLELRIDEDEVIRRLASRGRTDDRPETIRERLKAFYESNQALLDYYRGQGLLKTIDAQGAEEAIFGRIQQALSARPKQ